MGALGSLFGIGPAHQVQSQRGSAGFSDFGDDQMGGLMRNGSGMSKPNSYNSPGLPGMGYGPGSMPRGMGGMPGMMGMGGPGGMMGMGQMGQGGMGQGRMGQQRPQYPYGIQPPQGLQGQQPQQQGGMGGGGDPLSGIFGMLGGL